MPASLRRDEPGYFGAEDISVDRYLVAGLARAGEGALWSRVWQFACREEELAEVGDTEVYDIADKSYLLVRTAPGPGGIRAYSNACLHRGRALRDGPGRVDELLCSFHGFCWSLTGKLKRVPSAWDFPQVRAGELRLPEVRVGTWGGFVFLNPDSDCGSLEDVPRRSRPVLRALAARRTATPASHVSKVIRTQLEGRPGGLHGVLPRHHDPPPAAAGLR